MGKKRDDNIDGLVKRYKDNRDEDSEDSDEERPKKPFVEQGWFTMFVGFLITANAATMGLETDARGVHGEDEMPAIWYMIEVVFCIIFLIEISLRLYYQRRTFFTNVHQKNWNMADLFIVCVTLADTFVLTPIGSQGGLRLVSMLRFLRLLRLIRLVRLLRLFKELWLVASGLFESSKTLCWVALMIIVFLYICAIFTTLVIGKNDALYDPYFIESGGWDHEFYFATVPRSMFTLFQVVTFESWAERVVRHVMQKQPAMVIFFAIFIAIASFGLLNIVVGVVVESTLSTSQKDENKIKRAQERDRNRVFDHLREIFETADEDGNGMLTLSEVQKAINKPEIYNKLKMIEFPVEDPKQVFMLLDYDNTCELSIDEFINGCIRMKGQAKSKDLLAAQVAVDTMKRHYTFFEKEMKDLTGKIALLDDTARALVYQGEHVFLNLREYRMRHPELEGGTASPPRINTATIDTAPWEAAAVPAIEDSKIKQEAIWDQSFNRPDNLAIEGRPGAPQQAIMNNTNDMVLYQGMGGDGGGRQPPPPPIPALSNGQPALTNGNAANSQSRRNVQSTELAIPGQM
jgi:voltage-gated sodium channel